ncbi:MAG: P-loop NTPase [Actinobacteria bacterium]|nr:P-loop NTPase [Actinomycetota bacterium]
MAEITLPVIITAVADSDLEGFISGTLYSQGWNVIYRALDTASLLGHLNQLDSSQKEVVLIFSPDLPGISPEIVSTLRGKVKQVIGFSVDGRTFEDFPSVLPRPEDATALIALVRGFVRTPLLRSQFSTRDVKRRAKIIAIASPAGSSGCTTIAINLAMELSILGHETSLLDADVRRPSIATLLSLHGLDSESTPRLVAPNMYVGEFSRAKVPGLNVYMDGFLEKFDFVVVDLGSIEGLEDSLTDRRWTSSLIHWSCDNADELWLMGKADVLGIVRMEKLFRNFTQINIRAKLCLLLNMRAVGRKGSDQEKRFLSVSATMKPHRIFTLPKDLGAVTGAESARSALVEVNTRSPIRKAIVKLAVEVAS